MRTIQKIKEGTRWAFLWTGAAVCAASLTGLRAQEPGDEVQVTPGVEAQEVEAALDAVERLPGVEPVEITGRVEARALELKPEPFELKPRQVELRFTESDLAELEPRLAADPEEDREMRMLEDKLKDLEAATQRQRAQLETQLRQLRDRKLAREAERTARLFRPVPGHPLMMVRPEWKLGIVLSEPEKGKAGLGVTGVQAKSPSARAGIQVGDRLTSCNGISLRSVIALRLIIQAAEDQELNLLVNREGAQEALSFHVTPVRAAPAAGAVGGGGMVAPGAPSSGAGGGGGIAAPGGGLVIPRMAPYLDELRPVPRMRIERRQDDREVLERLDEVEKVLAHIRELLENAGIGRAEGGGAPEGSSEEGGALDE